MPADREREILQRLLEKARALRSKAYAPYSRFAVGAVLLCEDGREIGGVNVENASYGLGICAERSAAVAAIAQGSRDFRAIAIAGPADTATVPCGACRQFLNEFNPRMLVVYTTPEGSTATTLEHLLPEAFGPDSLP